MVWSFVYLAVRSVFALVLLVGRSDRSKELEILVLRHELMLLRRRSGLWGKETRFRLPAVVVVDALRRNGAVKSL